jgi:hypothetical protein
MQIEKEVDMLVFNVAINSPHPIKELNLKIAAQM